MWYNLKNGCSLKSTMLRLYVEIMNNDEYVYSNVNNEHTIIAMNNNECDSEFVIFSVLIIITHLNYITLILLLLT